MLTGTKRSNVFKSEQPTKKRKIMEKGGVEKEEEEDPLEAFMKTINKTAAKQKKVALKKQKDINSKSMSETISMTNNKKNGERIDLNKVDTMDIFIEQMQSENTLFLPSRKGTDGYNSDEEVYNIAKYVNKVERDKKENKNKLRYRKRSELKYDDYGNIITPDKDRIIEELEPIDHSKIYYPKVKKNFYIEHDDIKNMTEKQVKEIRDKYRIECIGDNLIKPVESFGYFNFDEKLMDIIIEQNFSKPTPIQMQAIPILLSGRNLLGLAATGSGKTAAFIWPIISHILDQDKIESNYDGAIGIILSPTRELASQTYKECKRYVAPFNLRVAPIYGGLQMYEQEKLLKSGMEIIVATPGRLIDLIKNKSTNCRRVTYLIIDEVDKMFSLGFESQIRSIIKQIRPNNNKQIAMFSATMNNKIEKIACDYLNDYIRVNIGNINISNTDINQYIEVLMNDEYKLKWLKTRINIFIGNGLVIIFCQSKNKCEILSRDLNNYNIPCDVIHGDKLQNQRQEIVNKFKKEKIRVLVATDVVSRGFNITNIKTVINYDCPHNMDTYIHRVGRTGRAGNKDGSAYTLLTQNGKNDKEMAPKLLNLLRKLRMPIPHQLQEMVNYNHNNNSNNTHNKPTLKINPLMTNFVKATSPNKKKRKTRWGN